MAFLPWSVSSALGGSAFSNGTRQGKVWATRQNTPRNGRGIPRNGVRVQKLGRMTYLHERSWSKISGAFVSI